MRALIGILFLVWLAGCADPRDTPIPREVEKLESIKPSVDKLSEEERNLLAGYLTRHTIGAAFGKAFGVPSDPIPEGITIGKAISEQREYIEKRRVVEAEDKAARDNAEAQRRTLADQTAALLSARLLNINLHKASYRDFDVENRLELAIELVNKGQKEISGIKGMFVFFDQFGDKISELPFKFEQKIPPNSTSKLELSKRFNQFDAEDKRLAGINPTTTRFEMAAEVVLFSDGMKFEAMKTIAQK